MSLAGEKLAVVSIGSSCQTAYQVRHHADLLSRLSGDELKPRRLPFDWVICGPSKAAAWIDSGSPFPTDADDLAPYEHEGVFHWRKRSVFFWHDFRNEQKLVDLPGTFLSTQTKYRALWDAFRRLSQMDRVVAVISNVQNNLPKVLGDDFRSDRFSFTADDIGQVKASLDRLLGRPCELLGVTYRERSEADLAAAVPGGIRMYTIEQNTAGWAGDDGAWQDIFLDYFSPEHRPADGG